jgi:hypothetical protein
MVFRAMVLISTGLMTIYAGGQQPNQRTRIDSNVLQASITLQ